MKKAIFLILILMMTTCLYLHNNDKEISTFATTSYTEPSTEFRAAWVSYYTGDVSYRSMEDYKKQINQILDNLEYYNMNAMIFHVRANHDAWYNSKINKTNSQLANVNFDEFDPLEYVITEAHKRGIEFHAWLNPYRIGSTYKTVESVANDFREYPNNPASNAENVLIGNPLQILNPAIPEVRSFIIDTCLELAQNYDIDAIHFDDYFYANGIDDSKAVAKYNTKNLSLSDFRREQVDTFIHDLKTALDQFNKDNKRFIQLGISPTGVYKNASSITEANTPLSEYRYNANGDLIYPTGATMGCQMHYESYLFCDTLKWVNNEWINYILPQTYWSTTHQSAPYEKLINWWNMAVKNKNVNLYSGMGIYMWTIQSGESLKQLTISSNLENVLGTSIYSYAQINKSITTPTSDERRQMNNIKDKAWSHLTILPEIAGMEKVKLGVVKNLSINNDCITWDKLEGAKFYIIYASKYGLNYQNDEIVDVIGGSDEILRWNHQIDPEYTYDVIPLSYSNTIGASRKTIATENESTIKISITLENGKIFSNQKAYSFLPQTNGIVKIDETTISNHNLDYYWDSSNQDVASIDEDGKILTKNNGTTEISIINKNDETKRAYFYLNVCQNEQLNETYIVKFVNEDGTLLKEEIVKYGSNATPPVNPTKESNEKYQYQFIGWDILFSNVTNNLTIHAVFESIIQKYIVTFVNADGEVFATSEVPYGLYAIPPVDEPTLPSDKSYKYRFKEWENIDQEITCNTIIKAIYNKYDQLYRLDYNTNGGDLIMSDVYYHYEEVYYLPFPEKENVKFAGWYFDEEFTMPCKMPFKLEENTTVYAKWYNKLEVIYHHYDTTIYQVVNVHEQGMVDKLSGPFREGYQFIGWKEADKDELFDFNLPICKSTDLYPVYMKDREQFKVTFHNDDESIYLEIEILEGELVLKVADLKKEGYLFKGWKKIDSEELFDFNTIINESIDLYPVFIKEDVYYNVNYCNEDSTIYQIVTVKENEKTIPIQALEKEGYVFKGWKQDSSSELFDFNLPISKNVDLYPVYEKIDLLTPQPVIPPKKNCKNKNMQIILLAITSLSIVVATLKFKKKN